MHDDLLFLKDTHPVSNRTAILEDDGISAWLYLTGAASDQIVRDVWVYNSVDTPEQLSPELRNGPPPATREYAGAGAVSNNPFATNWLFLWDLEGENVALFGDGKLMAAILVEQKNGYSQNIVKQGPWGLPMTGDIVKRVATWQKSNGS